MLHAGGTSVTILDCRDANRRDAIAVDDRYVAHNYSPLPVVAASAEGAWITDVEGRRYLDCLAAYSAVNFGHRNPEIIATAHAQLDSVTLVSRAFHSDRLGPFCEALAELCGKDMVLPMNSGAEAVESGIKVARKWGTDVKGVPAGRGQYRRGAQQLPRPHHHDHQLLRRRDRPPRLRPVHARLPLGAVRRRRRDGRRDRRQHRRGAARAHPGRGRHHRAARRLPAARARAVHRAQRADDRRRDPVRPGPHRAHLRLRPLGRGARHLPARQSPWRRRGSGVGGGGRPRRPRRAAPR